MTIFTRPRGHLYYLTKPKTKLWPLTFKRPWLLASSVPFHHLPELDSSLWRRRTSLLDLPFTTGVIRHNGQELLSTAFDVYCLLASTGSSYLHQARPMEFLPPGLHPREGWVEDSIQRPHWPLWVPGNAIRPDQHVCLRPFDHLPGIHTLSCKHSDGSGMHQSHQGMAPTAGNSSQATPMIPQFL